MVMSWIRPLNELLDGGTGYMMEGLGTWEDIIGVDGWTGYTIGVDGGTGYMGRHHRGTP